MSHAICIFKYFVENNLMYYQYISDEKKNDSQYKKKNIYNAYSVS